MSLQSHYRVRRRSQGSGLILVLMILLLAAVALGGAWLWQKADDKADEPATSDEQSTQEESAQSEEDDASEQSTEESSQAQPPEQSASATQSQSSPFEGLEGVVVLKGDWVDSTYFDDALFVGDSITTGIQIYNTMTNATVIANTGINPETILTKAVIRQGEETLTVLDAMKSHTPGKIYIMLGANGVAFLPKDTMMDYYNQFVTAVKEQHPNSIIYVQSILPVTAEKAKDEKYSNTRIDEYNLALMRLCKDNGVHYLNVAEAFKDESGALPADASPKDGMHFGPTYYAKWFDYLKCHTAQ